MMIRMTVPIPMYMVASDGSMVGVKLWMDRERAFPGSGAGKPREVVAPGRV